MLTVSEDHDAVNRKCGSSATEEAVQAVPPEAHSDDVQAGGPPVGDGTQASEFTDCEFGDEGSPDAPQSADVHRCFVVASDLVLPAVVVDAANRITSLDAAMGDAVAVGAAGGADAAGVASSRSG